MQQEFDEKTMLENRESFVIIVFTFVTNSSFVKTNTIRLVENTNRSEKRTLK